MAFDPVSYMRMYNALHREALRLKGKVRYYKLRKKLLAQKKRQHDEIRADPDAASAWKIKCKEQYRSNGCNSYLKRAYGISSDVYDEILNKQGGVCAICRGSPNKAYRGHLSVDHDHASGVVRGLLCDPCNLTLGKMRDSPALLRQAADYLEAFASPLKHRGKA